MAEEDFRARASVPRKKYVLSFAEEPEGPVTFTLRYQGKINHPIKQLAQEYARGFSLTPGLITEQGVYLGYATWWTPWFGDALFTFVLTANLPEAWDVVSQGTRTLHEMKEGRRWTRWESKEPMEEVYFIAATFTEYSLSAGAVEVMAFLRTPDENLANRYLETTAQYLEMYRKLLGPYPFSKFALVENFWQTGYGMPSFTLLGDRVIRLPFILHSSYPHELLHNYWGNSVYVDYKTGNWCEGTTVYMADHLIKEQRGAGLEYRRTALQKYTDYVTPETDFPLTKFLSRYNSATEAVGYGKAMMLWNMLRRRLGDETFVKGPEVLPRQQVQVRLLCRHPQGLRGRDRQGPRRVLRPVGHPEGGPVASPFRLQGREGGEGLPSDVPPTAGTGGRGLLARGSPGRHHEGGHPAFHRVNDR
jgi:aminopeptidase N